MIFFTIVSSNYLAYARTLFDSIRRHYPQSRLVLAIADDPARARRDLGAQCTVVSLEELALPHAEHFKFRYGVMELNTAIKPYVFRRIFERMARPGEAVAYLDPDIELFRPLTELEDLLHAGALAVLTPHLTAPIDDGRIPSELDILRTGAYNCGFIAIGDHARRAGLVDWWASRLEFGAFVDFEAGLFTDQRWIDLVPGMFPDVAILRHPGYDVAYWNLGHRRLARAGAGYTAGGEPLAFFHYSGIDPRDTAKLSKHQTRFTAEDLGDFRPQYEAYAARLLANGYESYLSIPYAFARLRDGSPIVPEMRWLFRHQLDIGKPHEATDPFGLTPADFERLSAHAPAGEPPISDLLYEIWRRRKPLREAYNVHTPEGRRQLLAWFASGGWRAAGVAAAHAEEAKAAPGTVARLYDAARSNATLRAAYHALPGSLLNRLHPMVMRAVAGKAESAKGINVIGYLRGDFGVAEAARAYASAAMTEGLPVRLLNFEAGAETRATDRRLEPAFSQSALQGVNLCFVNADQTPVLFERWGKGPLSGRRNIGYWFWELARFPQAWRGSAALVDEIWVATEFVRASVESLGAGKPVCRMPFPIDCTPSRSYTKGEFGIPEDRFAFLFSYDHASYVERKNPQALLQAFRLAFPAGNEQVVLVLKSMESGNLETRDPRVIVLDRRLDRDAMWGLESVCDCYVSLHRCEGLGLGLAESMYLGKPAIATGYSGNLQFMSEANSVLVDYRLVDVPAGAYPHAEGAQWAEPDIESAARGMRRVADDRTFRSRIAAAGREHVRQAMSPARAARALRERLAAYL